MLKGVPISECTGKCKKWNPKDASGDEQFEYVDISSVDRSAKAITSVARIACADAPSRARQLIRARDILVSTVRPNLNGVARVPSDLDGATASTGYCVLRPKPDLVDHDYLFHWVKTDSFVSEMTRRSTGANYPAVTDRVVRESIIPLPPLPEQRRIAAILDKADALRQKRRAAIAKLDQLLQSVFLEMFGDPVTNPRNAAVVSLGDLATVRTGRLDANASSPDGKYPFFTCARKPLRIDSYSYDCECVLVAGNGDLNVKKFRGKFDAYQRTYIVESKDQDKLKNDYLCQFLDMYLSELRRLSIGGIIKYIKKGHLTDAPLVIPSYAEQKRFVEWVDAVNATRAKLEQAHQRTDELFSSAQQRAFTGQL